MQQVIRFHETGNTDVLRTEDLPLPESGEGEVRLKSAFGQKKVLALLGALLLTGCGSMPSLEQLEERAFLSGDWSAVEKRERLIARRTAIRGPQCPVGMVAFCGKRGVQKLCGCADKTEMRELLSLLQPAAIEQ